MALPDLGSMKPEELSKLTPLQLLRYNSPLPHDDPESPYVHQEYPKFLYQVTSDFRLVSALVKSATEEAQLTGDWRESILDWGIITHPEQPRYEAGIAMNISLTSAQREQMREYAERPRPEPERKKGDLSETEKQKLARAALLARADATAK